LGVNVATDIITSLNMGIGHWAQEAEVQGAEGKTVFPCFFPTPYSLFLMAIVLY
jgi:hypothetical protein